MHLASLTNSKNARFLVLLLIMTGCSTLLLRATARRISPVFLQVTDKRPKSDIVDLKTRGNDLTVAVNHRGGIGKTKIVLKEGEWPNRLKFSFRNFKAIEGFKLTTESRQFEGAVSNSRKEQNIRIGEGFIATRKGNVIHIEAPKNFLKKGENFISIEWVDFYRN